MNPMTWAMVASAVIGAAGAASSPGAIMAPISPQSPIVNVLDGSAWNVSTGGGTARQDVQRIEGEPASGIGAQVAAASKQAEQAVGAIGPYLPWLVAGIVAVAWIRK